MTACTSTPTTSLGLPDRPLALPAYGASCPLSTVHNVLPDVGLGIGDGPIWPVGFIGGPADQPLGSSLIDGWYPIKILWAAAPSYQGPIRVRGQRLDQAGGMEFSLDGGLTLTEELDLPLDATGTTLVEPAGERQWPSYTLVTAPGCDGYQIDGSDFSATAVFQVTP